MALENLKSVFSDIKKFEKSYIEDAGDFTPQTDNDIINKPISTLDKLPITNTITGDMKVSPELDLNNTDKVTVFPGKNHLFEFGFNFERDLGSRTSGVIQEGFLHRLGTDGFNFETLYNDDGTATDNKAGGHLLGGNAITNLGVQGMKILNIGSPKGDVINDRIATDEKRIDLFLESQAGVAFVDRQNRYGRYQKYSTLYDKASTLAMISRPSEGDGGFFNPVRRNAGLLSAGDSVVQFFGGTPVDPTYTEYLDARAKGDKDLTYAEYDKITLPTAYAFSDDFNNMANNVKNAISNHLSNALNSSNQKVSDPDLTFDTQIAGTKISKEITSVKNMNNDMSVSKPLGNLGKGDNITLQPIRKIEGQINIEQFVGYGLPFYFRDLRDNRVIFLRAYLDGLSENISPSWTSTNYLGRSEPVYTYINSEREIQFTLKLFAQTKDELNRMYEKINRISSLCYPEYKKFEIHTLEEDPDTKEITQIETVGNNLRMKPPLTKIRIGDLIGSNRKEVTGFIKSLSYSVPEEAVWEIETNKQVPKYIEANIGFQVMHSTVPSLDYALQQDVDKQETFYGINQELFNPTN